MAITADSEAPWYEPVEQSELQLGSHAGPYAALNIPNPQPGVRYYWEYYNPRSNYSEVQTMLDQGWIPVREGDPEFGNAHQDFLRSVNAIDGLKRFGDVVCLKIKDEQYRGMQEENTKLAMDQLHGAAASHEAKGEERARQLRRPPKGRPMYYARSDHDISIENYDPTKVVKE